MATTMTVDHNNAAQATTSKPKQTKFPFARPNADDAFDEAIEEGSEAIGQVIRELGAFHKLMTTCQEFQDKQHAIERIRELAHQAEGFARDLLKVAAGG